MNYVQKRALGVVTDSWNCLKLSQFLGTYIAKEIKSLIQKKKSL